MSLDSSASEHTLRLPFDDPDCELDKVEMVDLSHSEFMINYIWQTGRLHPMLLQYTNLKILKAEKLGLIVVDEWIVQLKHLKEIHLSFNEITTWPQHLVFLDDLEILTMDGNPCLELQLRKSSSFRDTYFNLSSSNKNLGISHLVKGPEWPCAVQKRLLVNNVPGTFCGGIYRLASTASEEDDDFLTPMGRSRLDARGPNPPPLLTDKTAPDNNSRHSGNQYSVDGGKERSDLLIQLLKSISAISGLHSPLKRSTPHFATPQTLHLCMIQDKTMLKESLIGFLTEEHTYTIQLDDVLQLFLSSNVPGPFVKDLSDTFDSFPEIYLVHSKRLIKILKKLYSRLSHDSPLKINRVCDQLLYLFKNKEFESYVSYARAYTKSQWRLWCSVNPESNFDDELGNSSGRLGEWLYKLAMDNPMHSLDHATNYHDLPLKRLDKYCQFFRQLLHIFPELTQVHEQFDQLNLRVRGIIEDSRRTLRVHKLGEHYKISRERNLLNGYQWDALLKISSRVYLEEGSNRHKTSDVLSCRDDGRMTMSAVSEIFSRGERQIRLILCHLDLQIWDESVGKLVGVVDPSKVRIEQDDQLRVTFEMVDETCSCSLVSFACVKIDASDGEQALISALQVAKMSVGIKHEINKSLYRVKKRFSGGSEKFKPPCRSSLRSI